jgi:hypothetical protein
MVDMNPRLLTLWLVLSVCVFTPGCKQGAKSGSTDDLTSAKTSLASYFIATEANQFDEARKYVTKTGKAKDTIEKLESEVKNNPGSRPVNQNSASVEDRIAGIEGTLNGNKARLWVKGHPDIIYIMVKEKGVWLFDENASEAF